MEKELTALDAYTKRVYKIIMLIIPNACLSASITIIILHHLGYYANVSALGMYGFALMDVCFILVGLYLVRTGFDEDGLVKKEKLLQGKYAAAMMAILQWNAISYLWPFREFWAFILLFILGEAFFFDLKLVLFTSAGLLTSTFVSWIVNGEYLLPARNDFFVANMTFRMICLSMTIFCINILTYFGGKFLVEELEKYVYNDPLTHLLTRRKMTTCIQEAYDEALKENKPFSILMIDIDDFKKVNDTYGHDCGDEVLKMVANTISFGIKKSDRVFRWGGEEILVLLRTNEENAIKAAERIRKRVEGQHLNYRGENIVSVTITLGLTAFSPDMDIQAMMDDVDKKLYKGKQNGKNQLVYKMD